MAILLVTYDLRAPGQDYTPLHDYLKRFTHCKQMESVWLLDTKATTTEIRDALVNFIDRNDTVFVLEITRNWNWTAYNYQGAAWLNHPARNF